MRSACSRSTWASLSTPAAQMATSFSSRQSSCGAEAAQDLEHRLDVADARDVAHHDLVGGQPDAARIGRAPFLLPAGVTVPRERHAAVDDELLHDVGAAAPGAGSAARLA